MEPIRQEADLHAALLLYCMALAEILGPSKARIWDSDKTQAVVLQTYKTELNERDGQLSVRADFCDPELLRWQKGCRAKGAFQHLSPVSGTVISEPPGAR